MLLCNLSSFFKPAAADSEVITCSSAGGTLPSPLSRRAMASLDCDRSVDADQLAVCGSAVLRHEYT